MDIKNLKEIFGFGEDDSKRQIMREMKLLKKIKTSFTYLEKALSSQEFTGDLNNMSWSEGKSYDWINIKKDDVTMLIRRYQSHFTIFFKHDKLIMDNWRESRYSIITFNTDRDMLSDRDSDARFDNWAMDLNEYMNGLIEVAEKGDIQSLWNDYSYKREKYIKIKNVLDHEHCSSMDNLLFACDELFQKHLEVFSETDVVKHLESFRVGEFFKKDFHGDVIIDYIKTEVKNDYYHDIGLGLVNSKGEKKFEDVYSLSRWMLENLFDENHVKQLQRDKTLTELID